MNFKKIFLLLIVTLLFVGLSYASETSYDNTTAHTSSEVDTYTTDSIEEVAYTSNTQVKEVEDTSTDEKDTDKQITKQYNNSVKTSEKTYTVNDYNTLHNALKNAKYSVLTLNINSNITLSGNTELNKAITTLTINGNGYTINGNKKYQFLKINTGSTVTIKKLTIINCYKGDYGGAIDNSGKLILSKCIINNNKAESGGAIRNLGILAISKPKLYHNIAEYNWGDTVSNGGAIRNDGKLKIVKSKINNNTAEDGGAIYNNGTLTIINSTLNINTAVDGGAIYNRKKLVLNDSTLKSNKANWYGGAIINNKGSLTVNNDNFDKNQAKEAGGAIENKGGSLKIASSTFTRNTAGNGGAVDNRDGALKITSTKFTKNTADYGGAVYNTGNMTLKKNLFINNRGNESETVIDYEGQAQIKDNINLNLVKHYGTIYASGPKVTITNNTFDNAIKITILTIGSTKSAYVGNNVLVYGKLTARGKAVAAAPITITVDNKTYTTKTSKYGNYKINVTSSTAGTKTITATYKGSDTYRKSTNKTTYTSKQKTTLLTLGSRKSAYVGNNVLVYGKLTANGENLASAVITITVDGKTYTAKTTKYGNYKINVTSSTHGNKTITATYKGTNLYSKSTNKTTFMAYQKKSVITVGSTKNVKVGSNVSVYGKLTVNGTDLAYAPVTITVNGKTYNATTTRYGNYKITFVATTKGNQTITAKYAGTNLYSTSKATTTFKAS